MIIKGVELKIGSKIMLKPYSKAKPFKIDKAYWRKLREEPRTVIDILAYAACAVCIFDPEFPHNLRYILVDAIDRIIEPEEVST